MSDKFLELTVTDSVRVAQRRYYGGEMRPGSDAPADLLTEEALGGADVVLIATAHKVVDYRKVGRFARLVVDSRDAMRGSGISQDRLVAA